jgi:hypothetical protein
MRSLAQVLKPLAQIIPIGTLNGTHDFSVPSLDHKVGDRAMCKCVDEGLFTYCLDLMVQPRRANPATRKTASMHHNRIDAMAIG